MNRSLKILSLFMSMLLIVLGSVVPCFAMVETVGDSFIQNEQDSSNNSENTAQQNEYNTSIKICSNMGNWEANPENSAEAIRSTAAEYISIDIKLTKDKIPVLMHDDTLERMCVNESGETVAGKVSDYTYEELQAFYLRNKNGGSLNKKTESKITSLIDALKISDSKIFVLDFDIKDFEPIHTLIYSSSNISSKRIILRPIGDIDSIILTLSKKESVPNTILKYNGNIIFSANSLIKKAVRANITSVQFGTKNHHGVIFYNSFTKQFASNNLMAAFSMTDEFNGRREDNETGWDDVIGRGYNFIETNHPEMLSAYLGTTANTKSTLEKLLDESTKYENSAFPSDLKAQFNKARKSAQELTTKVASNSQLSNAYTKLYNVCSSLNLAENQTTSSSIFHFTPGRIITAVLCLAAVISAQIFFYKRKEKNLTFT